MSQGCILLVEDNRDDVDLTVMAFKEAGICNPVEVARDGQQALDYLFGTGAHAGRDLGEMPVVVLLDLKLPRVDGHEVLRRIRAEARTAMLPVVVLTSSKEEQDIVSSYSKGANAYVRKPVDFIEFSAAVRSLGVFWLMCNEPPQQPRKDGT